MENSINENDSHREEKMEKFIAYSENNNYDLIIFDFEKKQIVRLHQGVFTDETEKCRKYTRRKQTVIGGLWYRFLNGEIDNKQAWVLNEYIKIRTDSKKELDVFILSVQRTQILQMLEDCDRAIGKMVMDEQYYTYRF